MTFFPIEYVQIKMIPCFTGTDFRNVTQHKNWTVLNCNYMCNVHVDILSLNAEWTGAEYM